MSLLSPRTRRSPDARELATMATMSHDRMILSITRPPDGAVDYVRIVGEVDLGEREALDRAAAQLHDGASDGVCVDLGGTTFMDSTLVQFLEDLGDGVGGLVICRPCPMASRLIHLTGLDAVASVRADLPSHWPAESTT